MEQSDPHNPSLVVGLTNHLSREDNPSPKVFVKFYENVELLSLLTNLKTLPHKLTCHLLE